MQSSAVASVAREMEGSRTDKSGGVLASTDEGKETQRNGEATGESEVFLEPYRTLCPHYTRGCSFVSPCCGKVYLCRLCHNEQEHTHEIDRYKISEVVCRNCATRQPVAADCTKCGIRFGRYFCPVCRLYDDTDKKQFHCEKCGLCRIGGRENFFHCDTCGYCLATSMKNSHLCRRQASRDNCPVCMEDLHTSRNQMHVPDCGHLLHGPCFRQMLQKGLYQCPQCQKSLTDMSEAWKIRDEERRVWPMPLHLRNFRVKIQCRDCRQESETDFHMVGFKCGNCGSYNTVRCGNEELPEDNGERGEGEGGEAGGEGGRGRGGGVMQMVDALIQIARLRQQLRRVREGEREAEEEEQGEGEEEGEGEGEGEGEIGVGLIERILSLSDSSEEGEEEEEEEEEEEDEEEDEEEEGEEEEEEEEDSDERDSPPQPFPPDNESYDGDESEAESVGSHDDTHLPGAHGLAQPAARGRDWYQHESSSEPEWPMTLPVALDMSDWSDSFTQSDLRSLASNSSWETEEEEVIIGGAPHDLEANETRGEETQENWETGDNEGVETATGTTATVLPLTTYGLQVSRNLNAYDAHIRLDQNGTSEDSLSWETAHDDVTGDSTVPAGTTN